MEKIIKSDSDNLAKVLTLNFANLFERITTIHLTPHQLKVIKKAFQDDLENENYLKASNEFDWRVYKVLN